MSDKFNPYRVLGVPKDSTHAELKKAYKTLVSGLHPDKHSDSDKASLLSEINKAYHILKSPVRRKEYDSNKSVSSDSEINGKAMQIVVERVASILMGEDAITGDISEYLINMVEEANVQHNNLRERVAKNISRFNDNKDRILSRNDASDAIVTAMSGAIESEELRLRELDLNIKIGGRIIEIAKDLDILMDENPPQYTTSTAGYSFG